MASHLNATSGSYTGLTYGEDIPVDGLQWGKWDFLDTTGCIVKQADTTNPAEGKTEYDPTPATKYRVAFTLGDGRSRHWEFDTEAHRDSALTSIHSALTT